METVRTESPSVNPTAADDPASCTNAAIRELARWERWELEPEQLDASIAVGCADLRIGARLREIEEQHGAPFAARFIVAVALLVARVLPTRSERHRAEALGCVTLALCAPGRSAAFDVAYDEVSALLLDAAGGDEVDDPSLVVLAEALEAYPRGEDQPRSSSGPVYEGTRYARSGVAYGRSAVRALHLVGPDVRGHVLASIDRLLEERGDEAGEG